MRRTTVVASVLAGLGLAGVPAEPVAAQSRVVVPIIIQQPRSAPPRAAGPPSLHVTTRTGSPQPGVTTTRVTVADTTGAGRTLGLAPPVRALATVPLGTPSVLIRVDRQPAPIVGAAGRTRVTVEDVSGADRTLGGPAPETVQAAAGHGRQTVTITSDAPIDVPIVILTE
jgi:hypothetical protein